MERNVASKQSPVVLIVDDNADVRMSYRLLLEVDGFAVLEAPQARAAMAVLQARPVSVVLLDLYMPGPKDGLALIQAIRNRAKPHPVLIAMSGAPHLAYESGLMAARELGADAVLTKPVQREALLQTVRSLLDSAKEGPDRGSGAAGTT